MAIDCYKIEWTKPFPYKEAANRPEARQLGIYAIIETVKSKKIISYIGKSQELGRRIGDHEQGFSHSENTNNQKQLYSFGTIYSLSGSITTAAITATQLHEVESFFINKLQPVGNGKATKKRYKGTSLIVINIGKLAYLEKIMSHNEELLKLIKMNLKTKKATSSSVYF
jgi:hypothetical protein